MCEEGRDIVGWELKSLGRYESCESRKVGKMRTGKVLS